MKVKDLIKRLETFDLEKEVVVSILGTNVSPFPHYEKSAIQEVEECYEQNEIKVLKLRRGGDITLSGFNGDEVCICIAHRVI